MLYRNRFVKMEEEGGAGGEGAGGAGGASNSDAQIALLTKSVGMLAEGLQKMEGNQTNIIETLANITNQSKKEVKDDVHTMFGDDIDFEQLDRKDFAKYILAQSQVSLRTEMEKLLKGVDEKVSNLSTNFETKNANEQIEKAAAAHADFWEWSNEMKLVLKDHPNLSVARAYNLVKSENPDKVKELSKKYDKPTEKKEQSFLGLTPTSSIGTRDSTGKMTQKEAAEKAFDKVMGELGDVINNGSMKLY